MAEQASSEVERLFRRWLNKTVQVYSEEIAKMKIGDSGDLVRSVDKHFRRLSEGYIEGTISFDEYGRYVDMGSGRGYSFGKRIGAEETGRRNRSGRKKKPFHGRAFYGRLNSLQGAIGYELMEQASLIAKRELAD